MLKRLTRKLFTLFVLVAALATFSAAPEASANWWPRCQWVPVDQDCLSGYMCCDESGYCWC